MSRIALVEASDAMNLPEPVMRRDLAWAMFWPKTPAGSLPEGGGEHFVRWACWLWESLGYETGSCAWARRPPSGCWPSPRTGRRGLVTRLLSFWTADVYWVEQDEAKQTDFTGVTNRWFPPVRDVHSRPAPGSVWDLGTASGPNGEDLYLS
ncbi:MAG: hypothetical protein ACP5QO_08780 [Clostridia bacterium]